MTNVIELIPTKESPVPEYKICWFDLAITVGCAALIMYIIMTGLFAMILVYGAWAGVSVAVLGTACLFIALGVL